MYQTVAISFDKCTEKGVVVFNTPGANANGVKELVYNPEEKSITFQLNGQNIYEGEHTVPRFWPHLLIEQRHICDYKNMPEGEEKRFYSANADKICVEMDVTCNIDFTKYEFKYKANYPALINDTNMTNFAKKSLKKVVGNDKVFDLTEERGGIMIPAHIEKTSNSLISNLGFVPPDSRFLCAELKDLSNLSELKALNPYLNRCNIITNSDAHALDQMNEAVHFLNVKNRTAQDVLLALKGFYSNVDK